MYLYIIYVHLLRQRILSPSSVQGFMSEKLEKFAIHWSSNCFCKDSAHHSIDIIIEIRNQNCLIWQHRHKIGSSWPPWHDLLGSPRVILNGKIFFITQIPANMKIVTYKTFYDISFFEIIGRVDMKWAKHILLFFVFCGQLVEDWRDRSSMELLSLSLSSAHHCPEMHCS